MKKKIMRVLPLIMVVAVLILIINNVHIQSVEEFYGFQTEEESEEVESEGESKTGASEEKVFEEERDATAEESEERIDDEDKSEIGTVTLSITCTTVFDNWDSLDDALKDGYIPEDGVILEETSFPLHEGDTVFDILLRAVQQEGIQMEYQGMDANAFGTVYIEGINYLYEFSCGPLSGWMYTVNGETPDYGCSVYEPEDGDVIEWLYTCDLGNDI